MITTTIVFILAFVGVMMVGYDDDIHFIHGWGYLIAVSFILALVVTFVVTLVFTAMSSLANLGGLP